MAFQAVLIEWNERVGFRKIGCQTAPWNIVGDNPKARHAAFDPFVMRMQIDQLAILKATCLDVLPIHKYHPTAVEYASVAVVIAINGGVELIVAADSRHQKLPFGQFNLIQLRGSEIGLAGSRFEVALASGIGQVEACVVSHSAVVVVKTGDTSLYGVADVGIIVLHLQSVDGR